MRAITHGVDVFNLLFYHPAEKRLFLLARDVVGVDPTCREANEQLWERLRCGAFTSFLIRYPRLITDERLTRWIRMLYSNGFTFEELRVVFSDPVLTGRTSLELNELIRDCDSEAYSELTKYRTAEI